MEFKAAVITVSDKGSKGERVDTSGPALCKMLENDGWEIVYTTIIPDDFDTIKTELMLCADEKKIPLVLTTGGTGFSPRDNAPEATMAVATKNALGIAEYMRAKSFEITPKGMLSRGVSVIRNNTLIINLPGSPKAVRENLGFILPALDHGLEILLGRGGECGQK